MLLPLWLLYAWPALIAAQDPFVITSEASQNVGPTRSYTTQSTTRSTKSSAANGPQNSGSRTASTFGGASVSSSGLASVSMATTAATILSPGATASSSGNPSSSTSSSSSGLTSDAKIGIGVGVGVGAAAIIAGLGFFFVSRRRRRDNSGRYAPAQSAEQLRVTPVMKDAAPPFMAAGALAGGATEARPSLSRRTSNRSALRPPSQRSLAQSTSRQQAQPPLPGAASLTPKASRSPRLSFEAPSTREGNRPQLPSIFTEVFSPMSGHHDDHEPVSPVSPVSEVGSRPPSPR